MSVSSVAPSNHLICNGSLVNRVGVYANLFAAIGTTYGIANGLSTFALPNFQGAFYEVLVGVEHI